MPGQAAPVQAFEVFVDRLARTAIRVGEQVRDAVFQLQQARQVGVFADLAFDRARVQLQLAFTVFAEGADTVALADQVASHTQADHQQNDQWWQQQLAEQAGFHGRLGREKKRRIAFHHSGLVTTSACCPIGQRRRPVQ